MMHLARVKGSNGAIHHHRDVLLTRVKRRMRVQICLNEVSTNFFIDTDPELFLDLGTLKKSELE